MLEKIFWILDGYINDVDLILCNAIGQVTMTELNNIIRL
jgi:hypothetical protein